jgi:hypothetical protein
VTLVTLTLHVDLSRAIHDKPGASAPMMRLVWRLGGPPAQFKNLQMRLIKIAARITETGRSGSHRIRRRLPGRRFVQWPGPQLPTRRTVIWDGDAGLRLVAADASQMATDLISARRLARTEQNYDWTSVRGVVDVDCRKHRSSNAHETNASR